MTNLIKNNLNLIKIFFLIFPIAAFFCLPADSDLSISNYSNLYIKGKKLFFKEDYQGAIQNLQKAIVFNPKEIKALTSLGMSYYKLGDKENARKYWLSGYNLDPQNSELYGILQKVNVIKEEKQEEQSADTFFRKGNLNYKEGNYKEAVENLEKAIQINPKNAVTYFTLGAAYHKLGDKKKTIDNWEIALRLNPEDKMILELMERLRIKMVDDENRGSIDVKLQKELETMVFVPAGEFLMGSDREFSVKRNYEAGVDEFPQHKVYVDSFYIDKYEVTNYRYKKFIDVSKRRPPFNDKHPDDPYIWRDNKYKDGEGNYPVTLVNWYDVNAYCQWKQKKLPTEAQWEKAARGTDARLWPWGNEEDNLRSNTGDFKTKQLMYVGNFTKGISPYGVYNMSGNAEEWTDTWYNPYSGSDLKRENHGEKEKVIKGGSYLKPFRMFSRTAERSSQDPKYGHRSLGFRCARSG